MLKRYTSIYTSDKKLRNTEQNKKMLYHTKNNIKIQNQFHDLKMHGVLRM